MKLRKGRLALCVVLATLVILGLPASSQACGPGTHHEVVDRACEKLDRQAYPQLAHMVCDNRNDTYAGAVFVDWACGKHAVWGEALGITPEYGTWSEAIHDDEFLDAYLRYLLGRRVCPPPAAHCKGSLTADDRYDIAFLFGMIAHHEADEAFHGPHPDHNEHPLLVPTKKVSELEPDEVCHPYKVDDVEVEGVCRIWSFLEEAKYQEKTDHTGGEGAAEAFVNQFHGQIGNPPAGAWGFRHEAVWYAYGDMSTPIYVARSCTPIPWGDLCIDLSWEYEESGMLEQLVSDEAQEVRSSVIVHIEHERDGKWTWIAENLVTWPAGGLDDMANHTVAAWQHYWDLLAGRPEVASVTIAGVSEGAPGEYTFTTAFEPANASPPVGWMWDNGATTAELTRQLAAVGSYTLWVTATNYWGGPLAKASHTIVIDTDATCPAGPALTAACEREPPPYYVVVNGLQACLERDGSGCSPFVLAHPECTSCATCNVDVETEVCKPYLTGKVPEGQKQTVYEMCQSGMQWISRMRTLDSLGNCPVSGDWTDTEPPMTGVPLPAPVIVGGLAILGTGFMAAGLALRRRKS